MALWEQLLLGGLAILVLLWFGPGVKQLVESSRKGSRQDWLGFLVPMSAVVGFVLLLIVLARA